MSIKALKIKWDKEKNTIPNITFVMFVYRNKEQFINEQDLKSLYYYAGFKNYFSWKRNFVDKYPNIFKQIEEGSI